MVSLRTRNPLEDLMRNPTRKLTLALAVAALGLVPAAALADHGADDRGGDDHGGLRDDDKRDEKRVAGSCTGGSTAKLKVKHDDGRLETEFEVDQNRNGVQWTVRLRREGKLVVKTNATTSAPSGSFSVERKIADPAGSDRITARAKSPSGEVCTAAATI
jgi:hypothetical protein